MQCLLLPKRNAFCWCWRTQYHLGLGDLPFWNFDPFEILLSPRELIYGTFINKPSYKNSLSQGKPSQIWQCWKIVGHYMTIFIHFLFQSGCTKCATLTETIELKGSAGRETHEKTFETWTPLFYEIRIPPFIPWGHIPARKRFIDVSIYVIYIYLNIHMDVILLYCVCVYIYIIMASPRVYHIQHTSIHMTWSFFHSPPGCLCHGNSQHQGEAGSHSGPGACRIPGA